MESYKAFISYSHAADGKLAPALQSALHKIGKPWFKLRAMRIFRDKTNLSATPKLWSTIENSLAQAEYFLLLASPEASQSQWVNKEIQWWLENRSIERLLILITGGNVEWTSSTNDFDWDRTDALPIALKNKFIEEPLFVDFRWAKTADDISLRNSHFRSSVLDVAATLLGKSKDYIDGEDVRLHRKARNLGIAAVSIIVSFSIIASIASFFAYKRGQELYIKGILNSARTSVDPLQGALLLREIEAKGLGFNNFDFREVAIQITRNALPKTVLRGHAGAITDANFSNDGSRVATASEDGTVRVWSSDTGKEMAILKGHQLKVTSVYFDAAGDLLLSASYDGTARIWKTNNPENPIILQHEPAIQDIPSMWCPPGLCLTNKNSNLLPPIVHTAGFSPDGRYVLTWTNDFVRLWDVKNIKDPFILDESTQGSKNRFVKALFSSDGKKVVILSSDSTVKIINTDRSSQPIILKDGKAKSHSISTDTSSDASDISISPNNQYVVTDGTNGELRIWKIDGSGQSWVLKGNISNITGVGFSPDSQKIVTSSGKDNSVGIWLTDGSSEPTILKVNQVTGAIFSPDGDRILISSEDGSAQIRNVYEPSEPILLLGHGGEITAASFSPDNTKIVTGSEDGSARIWMIRDIQEPKIIQNYPNKAWMAMLSPKSNKVVAAREDGTAIISNIPPNNENIVLKGHEAPVVSASFSQNGENVITASLDGTARIWIAKTGQQSKILSGHLAPVVSGQFSPDGHKVVTASFDRTARIWTLDDSEPPIVFRGHNGAVTDAAFSPDGSKIATASYDGAVRVWNANDNSNPIVLNGHSGRVLSVNFRPDAKKIVSSSYDRTAMIWNSDGSGVPLVLKGHKDTVWSAVFSSDGSEIVTASEDHTAKIWNNDMNRVPITLLGHTGQVRSAFFSHDGQNVITASFDGKIKLWRVTSTQLMSFLEGITNACLTSEQRGFLLAETPKQSLEEYKNCELQSGR